MNTFPTVTQRVLVRFEVQARVINPGDRHNIVDERRERGWRERRVLGVDTGAKRVRVLDYFLDKVVDVPLAWIREVPDSEDA